MCSDLSVAMASLSKAINGVCYLLTLDWRQNSEITYTQTHITLMLYSAVIIYIIEQFCCTVMCLVISKDQKVRGN